jgi:ankyrin repeat protein
MAVYLGKPHVAEALRELKGNLDVFEASAMGDQHQLSRILEERPDAHREFSPDGFTPLGYAAFFGHIEAVRSLVARGADPNVKSMNGIGAAPLHSALAEGRKEMARTLVEAGADVNAASAEGWTPLHYAAETGDIETARYLLAKGANPSCVRPDGKTPAQVAGDKGYSDLASALGA